MNARATMTAGVSWGAIGLEGSLVGRRGLADNRDGWSLWSPACGCNQYSKPCATTGVVSVKRLGKFRRGARLGLVCSVAAGGLQLRRRPTDVCPVPSRMHAELSKGRVRGSSSHPSGLHILELAFVPDLGSSAKTTRQTVRCSVGVSPHEESKPDSEDHSHEQHSIARVPGENFSEKPVHVDSVPEEVMSQVGGKAGSISFYARRSDSFSEDGVESVSPSPTESKLLALIWPLGPFILVASVVLPPLYLRKIFGALLEDSLVTDFVILFFTETLFFIGAWVFLYTAHISRQANSAVAATLEQSPASPVYSPGYRLSAKMALGVGLLLPVASFVMVWPWTGPAAAAALAPYMIGLLVQLGFEQIIHAKDSPVWPLVPVTFQMYRLHQLNRAAQLVAGLLFSLKGVEATAETMAINGSLQTLLFVLQVLGMLSLWSLGSFLTNQLPSKCGQTSIPSMP